MHKNRITFIGIIVVAWIVIALFFTSQMYFLYPRTGTPFILLQELEWEFAFAFVWICATPVVFWLARKWQIQSFRHIRTMVLHFVLSFVISFFLCAFHGVAIIIIHHRRLPNSFNELLPSFYYNIDKMIMVYWIIILITNAYKYYLSMREKEQLTAQLTIQLAQAELNALKMQLHPHFLFNTLNAITTLMNKDTRVAEQMISRLSILLRSTLDNTGKQTIPLIEELKMLDNYLEIEKIRFQDRLTVHKDIAEETLSAFVPNLILQPIVENAIKYGIAPFLKQGMISIKTSKNNSMLNLIISDNGEGFRNLGETLLGIGLKNVQARLMQLYGSLASLQFFNNQGAVVVIIIPFKTEQ